MIGIIKVYGGMLLAGLGQTLLLTLLALIIAMVIGMIFGLMNVGHNRVPLIVLAYFVYFGIPAAMQQMGMTNFRLSSLQAGIIALSMNCGAYMAEIIRAGIESVDRGQMEASRSLGLSYGASMALVVVPQAVRTMIPSIINQFIITLKDTSILSVVAFPELTLVGKTVMGNTFKPLQSWAIVGIMYMVVIVTLSKIAKRIERRVNRGR